MSKSKIIILVIILVMVGVGIYIYSGFRMAKTIQKGVGEIAEENRLKLDMSHLLTDAQAIWPKEEEGYLGFNCENSILRPTCDTIEQQIGSKPIIHQSKDGYCAYIKLPTKEPGETQYICIDSTFEFEAPRKTPVNPSKRGYCDGVTFVCPPKE